MASSMAEMKKTDGGLEYLGFARMIAISTVMCVFNLYEYAKQKSGPLKSSLGTIENAVTTVLGPLCRKYKGVPDDALAFLDRKVAKAVSKLEARAPPLARTIVRASWLVVHKGAEISQEMVEEVLVAGPLAAIYRFTTIFKNFVVGHLLLVLGKVSHFPVINLVSQKVIPTATKWSRKYNSFVTKLAARGYHFFSYFPLVPIEGISKAFKKDN